MFNIYYRNTCGSTTDHCGSGCQSKFGLCAENKHNTRSIIFSTDGTCGENVGMTCSGSRFGRCCSKWGYCGSNDQYCGEGCQYSYGGCSTSILEYVDDLVFGPPPDDSTDGTCGGTTGNTCFAIPYSPCCSQYGCEFFILMNDLRLPISNIITGCGATSDYCDAGCQPQFGVCNSIEPSTPASQSSPPRAYGDSYLSSPPSSISSLSISSSSTSSSSIACETNYLSNGNWDTGSESPWSISKLNTINYNITRGTSSLPTQSGSYELAITSEDSGSGLSIQQIISIPSGTTVECEFYGRLSQSDQSSWVFTAMTIDGSYCTIGNFTENSTSWTAASKTSIIVDGDSHQVNIEVYVDDSKSDLVEFELDSISISPSDLSSC